jgi:hypothetical protein
MIKVAVAARLKKSSEYSSLSLDDVDGDDDDNFVEKGKAVLDTILPPPSPTLRSFFSS